MALLGLRPKLMGTAGRDFPDYRRWLEDAGVDTSTVRQLDDVFTASFFCNTDLENNQIASFYAGAMGHAGDYLLADATDETPDLVIVSPNDPRAMTNLTQECRDRDIPFIYDPSQQVPRLKGLELDRDMDGAYAMIVNGYELEVISQKTGKSLDELRQVIDILVITHGPKGSTIYDNRAEPSAINRSADGTTTIRAFPAGTIHDPTGGGDAFRAGFVYGLAREWPLDVAAQIGSLVATYCIEQVGTQSHHFTRQQFVERYRTVYDDEGVLDTMLT
jgi:adenosine kinase